MKCPRCGAFAGQWLRDMLGVHKGAQRVADIDKKQLKILPPRNGKKPVFCYLLVHPDWLRGAPGEVDGVALGGYADGTPDENASWYAERLNSLRLIEVRGQIKLSEDESAFAARDEARTVPDGEQAVAEDKGADESVDRKDYGLPHYITLADGSRVNTRSGTVPKQSHFTCGGCGQCRMSVIQCRPRSGLPPSRPMRFSATPLNGTPTHTRMAVASSKPRPAKTSNASSRRSAIGGIAKMPTLPTTGRARRYRTAT